MTIFICYDKDFVLYIKNKNGVSNLFIGLYMKKRKKLSNLNLESYNRM